MKLFFGDHSQREKLSENKLPLEEGFYVSTYLTFLVLFLSDYCHRVFLFFSPFKRCLRFKGQIISKGLFGVLKFSQKTNERIRRSSKNEFVCSFFGRIRGYQKSFWNHLTFSMYSKITACTSFGKKLIWYQLKLSIRCLVLKA